MLKGATSVVFLNFKKLSVSDTNVMRRDLRKEGIGYSVVKKTLLHRALKDEKLEGEVPELAGEVAIAYGADPIGPARGVFGFQKKFKEQLAIMGGIFQGKFIQKAEVENIASIPPLQVLYAQFVNIINSPIQGLVIALDGIAKTKTE